MPAVPPDINWPVDVTGDPAEVVHATEAARVIGHPRPDRLPHGLLDLADHIEYNPDGTVCSRGWKRETLWTYAHTVMAMRATTIDGRLALNRAGVADRLGMHISAIHALVAATATNGFPEPVDGRWFFADEIDAWDEHRRQLKSAALTAIDYSGDPGDLVIKAEVARIVGYAGTDRLNNSSLWRALVARNEPAHNVELPKGGVRLRFPRRLVWELAEARTGRSGRPVGAVRTVDRSGDPDELVSAANAAKILGYKTTAGLPRELLAQADDPGPPRRFKRRTLWEFNDRPGTKSRSQ